MPTSIPVPVVFIVDDDNAVRAALSLLVQTCGWKAKTCASGGEFFAALASAWPACILIDLELRDMDGAAVQREISRLRMNLPVIALTRYEGHPGAPAAESGGARAVIAKPFRCDELIAAIAEIIGPPLERAVGAGPPQPLCT